MEKEQKVKIKIQPPSRIVIHNISKMELIGLMKSIRTPMGNMPLMWVDGYAFIINAMPLQGRAISLYMIGELHYTDVLYCIFPKFTEVVSLNNEMTTNMFNMSNSIIHRAIRKAIAEYDKSIVSK